MSLSILGEQAHRNVNDMLVQFLCSCSIGLIRAMAHNDAGYKYRNLYLRAAVWQNFVSLEKPLHDATYHFHIIIIIRCHP